MPIFAVSRSKSSPSTGGGSFRTICRDSRTIYTVKTNVITPVKTLFYIKRSSFQTVPITGRVVRTAACPDAVWNGVAASPSTTRCACCPTPSPYWRASTNFAVSLARFDDSGVRSCSSFWRDVQAKARGHSQREKFGNRTETRFFFE